jgi:hypothetical protein
MVYPHEFEEYVVTKLETSDNRAQIARELIEVFDLNTKEDLVRRQVSRIAQKHNIAQGKKPIKRLFFDIETSFVQGWFWRTGWKQRVGVWQIKVPKKIICICYKWQHEDKVHSLQWDKDQDDKVMLQKFVQVLGNSDEAIGHNIDKFDLPEIRTRCIKQDVLMFPTYRTLDTYKKAKKYFQFESNALNHIGQVLKVGKKIPTTKELWEDIIYNKSKKALKDMVAYCKQDVILNEDVFTAMMPYIDHNTNFAVLKGKDKWHCPECSGMNVKLSHTDTTPMGYVKRHMKCNDCRKFFKVSNKTYLRYLTGRKLEL